MYLYIIHSFGVDDLTMLYIAGQHFVLLRCVRILQLYFDVFFRLKAVGVPVYVVVVPIGRCHGYRFYAEISGQYIIRVLGVSIHGDGAAIAGRHPLLVRRIGCVGMHIGW